jgi:hypothetical protein
LGHDVLKEVSVQIPGPHDRKDDLFFFLLGQRLLSAKGRQPIETIATSRHSEVKYVSATGASGLMLLKWLLMCRQQ